VRTQANFIDLTRSFIGDIGFYRVYREHLSLKQEEAKPTATGIVDNASDRGQQTTFRKGIIGTSAG